MQNLSTPIVNNNLPQAAQNIHTPAQNHIQNLPQQYYAVQNPIANTGAPQQSSGVNIVIYNPSVNPTAGSVANSNNSYAQPMAYPPNYYLQQPQPTPSSAVAQSYLANTPIKEETKTESAQKEPENKEETHKENIVQLTDEYIKTLENYLNNQNPKVREMGMKELLERFKEHKSRKNDIALTNLLNKALQDGSKSVRFLALAALDAGYAQGDELTTKILEKMQSSKEVFGEDAMMASEILLQKAGNKVEIEVPGPKPEDKKSAAKVDKKGK